MLSYLLILGFIVGGLAVGLVIGYVLGCSDAKLR
jgi:hypothetical protein